MSDGQFIERATLDNWSERDQEQRDRIKELEAKLAQGTIVEYDDGSRVSLSAFAGGASESGVWSHLTLMKEEQDGAVSFRHYTADGGWCSPCVHSTLEELKEPSVKQSLTVQPTHQERIDQ